MATYKYCPICKQWFLESSFNDHPCPRMKDYKVQRFRVGLGATVYDKKADEKTEASEEK